MVNNTFQSDQFLETLMALAIKQNISADDLLKEMISAYSTQQSSPTDEQLEQQSEYWENNV